MYRFYQSLLGYPEGLALVTARNLESIAAVSLDAALLSRLLPSAVEVKLTQKFVWQILAGFAKPVE